MAFRPLPVLVVCWALAGLGAGVGSVLGNAFGKTGLFAGAIVGGIVAIAAAVALVAKLGWLPTGTQRGAFVGGLLGFTVAASIAVANLHTPITPVLITSVVGAGVLAQLRHSTGDFRANSPRPGGLLALSPLFSTRAFPNRVNSD